MNGGDSSSTAVTSPLMISVPNRSACVRNSAISSGPMTPSRYPGEVLHHRRQHQLPARLQPLDDPAAPGSLWRHRVRR